MNKCMTMLTTVCTGHCRQYGYSNVVVLNVGGVDEVAGEEGDVGVVVVMGQPAIHNHPPADNLQAQSQQSL